MSAAHVFESRQWVAQPLDRTFALFSDAYALERITPPWLGFRVLTPAPIELEAGALIDYRLRLRRLPVRWRTRIADWDPPHSFVDEQLRGPYRSWQHAHSFAAEDGGTTIADRVDYEMPLGPLGALAHRALVRRDLERIFAFRRAAIDELLGAMA